jgi:hypothetical protein
VEIRDWYDLDSIRDNLGDSYILMNDLDSTTAGYTELAGPTANNGTGWQPIGIRLVGLSGTFDGQGYEIRDLFIDSPEENHVGLFVFVHNGGVIENVGVVNAIVHGDVRVGGLVAENHGTVRDSYYSHSSGNVTGSIFVGGLVGFNGETGTVSNSYSTSNVTAGWGGGGLVGVNGGTVSDSYATGTVDSNHNAGGLVGQMGGTVVNCYATGDVTGVVVEEELNSGNGVGGLVGTQNGGTVSDSYATGTVTGNNQIGGLVGNSGYNNEDEVGSTISDSYATGAVAGNESVGGLMGVSVNQSTVDNSFATGSVTGNVYVGGLVGENQNSVSEDGVINSFWDTETSGQVSSAGGTSKTTAEMKDTTTFTGWDIIAVSASNQRDASKIWNIVTATTYPFLSWEPVS